MSPGLPSLTATSPVALHQLASPAALAQSKHGSKEEQADAKRHRAMAAAHEAAAKCLEAGKGEKACLEQLRKAGHSAPGQLAPA